MNPTRLATLTLLAAATLAACSSVPDRNAMLDQARSDYRNAQAMPPTQTLAAAELRQAGDSLALAEAAFAARDGTARVDQLAYLARQRVALAQEVAARRQSEAQVAESAAARDQLRLQARTQEADAAQQKVLAANRDAAASQRQSAASQQVANAAQQQAGEAERRNLALENQLRELNAKKTERGMVVTIGDVLFDSGQSQLKSGGMQNIQRLSGFLKEYPQRKALIEGYTDSVGGEAPNLALSGRRADAVMGALLETGVKREQLAAQGYGETHPVAGNDNASGRQMNRRVEIVLSDESGVLTPR